MVASRPQPGTTAYGNLQWTVVGPRRAGGQHRALPDRRVPSSSAWTWPLWVATGAATGARLFVLDYQHGSGGRAADRVSPQSFQLGLGAGQRRTRQPPFQPTAPIWRWLPCHENETCRTTKNFAGQACNPRWTACASRCSRPIDRVRQQVQTRSILALTHLRRTHRRGASTRPGHGSTDVPPCFDRGQSGCRRGAPSSGKSRVRLSRWHVGRRRVCARNVALSPCRPLGRSRLPPIYPSIDPDDLRGYLELRAEREFSIPTSELRLGFSAYDASRTAPSAPRSPRCPAKRLEAVEAMLARRGSPCDEHHPGPGRLLPRGTHGRRCSPSNLHFLADGGYADVVVLGRQRRRGACARCLAQP